MDKILKLQEKVDMIFKDCEHLAVLRKVLGEGADKTIEKLSESGLRGRGGAGFYTSLKWQLAKDTNSDKKYVICNADEGEPGTFKDREILERVPEKVLLGMAICASVIGANEGFIYLRGEYNYLKSNLQSKIDQFNKDIEALLNFKIKIFSGSGAYVCGEESALIESMEGKRGEPRNKPPFPVTSGYLGKPTVLNNVETLVYVSMIMDLGPEKFANLGTKDHKGGKLFSVSGDTPYPGVYELELGMTLQELVDLFGDGDTKAVQVGGATGFCVPRKKFADTMVGFAGVPTIMLFNNTRSMYNVLHNYLHFFSEESCGQCTPCRVGCQQLLKGIEAVKRKEKDPSHLEQLQKLSETMRISSKCGLGQSVPNAFNSIVNNFREQIIF
jgi:[NiFe] hydrogenase diaphorase moiety large subunit